MESNISARFEELLVERLRTVLQSSGHDPQSMAVYILRMLANRHTPDHMVMELQDFMDADAAPFVQWIFSTIEGLSAESSNSPEEQKMDELDGDVEMQNVQQESRQSRRRDKKFDLRSQLDASDHRRRGRPRDVRARSSSPAALNDRHCGGRRRQGDSSDRVRPAGAANREARRVARRGNSGEVVVTIQSRAVSSNGKTKAKKEATLDVQQQPARINMRCSYWPNCRNTDDTCPFVHPTEPCRFFPHCTNPATCIYVHPTLPCKFQGRCLNPTCNYQHVTAPAVPAIADHNSVLADANATMMSSNSSAVICRFHPDCKNPTCTFFHPPPVECRFGLNCTRPDCHFAHPPGHILPQRSWVNAPCRFGPQCTRTDCFYQHDAGKTMEDAPMAE